MSMVAGLQGDERTRSALQPAAMFAALISSRARPARAGS
jgi:hypothetical protein